MMRSEFIFLLTSVAVILADDIIVLNQGSLKGHRLTTRKGGEIFAFQGIPYANPPVGELRFQPPQAKEPWSGVLDATKEAPVCVQRGIYPGDNEIRGQEDCLYLNVYTPRMPDSTLSVVPLDVMFWIHGGGWFNGSGNTDFYGPQYLLDKDIILVTINYRLGTIGFISTEDAACPGNNGMKDQVAALRWVRDNIAAFGGNPSSVTIFGESAGGASVHYHMLSPASKGLFHRAISQSGNALGVWAFTPKGRPKYLAEKVADLFDCPAQPSAELISCLRKQDSYKLFKAELSISGEGNSPVTFGPVTETEVGKGDEPFVTDHPLKMLLSSDLEPVPWMTGIMAKEGGFFLSFGFLGEKSETNLEDSPIIELLLSEYEDKSLRTEITQKIQKFYFGDKPTATDTTSSLIDMITDIFFFSGTNNAVKLHSSKGATVYYYYFDYRGTNSFSTKATGSAEDYGPVHLDDVLYLFPQNHTFPNSKLTPEDEHMVETLTTLWVNFARQGKPAPSWNPVSSPDVLDYARIAYDGLHPGQGLLKERIEFWDSLQSRFKKTSDKDEL